jgi:segregation and condensation protein A
MRNAAATLMTRRRLGRDVFARGMPEGVRTIRVRQYTAVVYDLLKATPSSARAPSSACTSCRADRLVDQGRA